MNGALGRMTAEGSLFTLGRSLLGPTFCCYVTAIIERSQALGTERLFFLAREGHLFQRMYARLAPMRGAATLPSSYLYVSRLSTALPSVHRFGLRELRLGSLRTPTTSAQAILSSFGLYNDEMKALAHAAGIGDPAEVIRSWWDDERLEKLIRYAPFEEMVADRAADGRAQLRQYLTQEGLFAVRRAALVDIGWGGTIQNNLMHAYAADRAFPELHGLYFGLGDGALPPFDDRYIAHKEGLVFDARRHRSPRQRAILYFLELFEQAARAGHGTTLGYERSGEEVVPVLKESGMARAAELAAQPAIDELQRGIFSCIDEFPAWLSAHGGTVEAALPAVWRELERVIFVPTRAELASIAQLSHSDDWGADSHRGLVEGAGSPMTHPRAWFRGFHAVHWKPGYLRQTMGPVGCHLYRQYRKLRALAA